MALYFSFYSCYKAVLSQKIVKNKNKSSTSRKIHSGACPAATSLINKIYG